MIRAARVDESIAERALRILEVVPGERPLLPEFGWRGHLLGALDGPAERGLAGVLAEEALRRWAPDIEVERVLVELVDGARVSLRLELAGDESRRVRVEWRGGEGRGAS